jgi:hypothetical protein
MEAPRTPVANPHRRDGTPGEVLSLEEEHSPKAFGSSEPGVDGETVTSRGPRRSRERTTSFGDKSLGGEIPRVGPG